MVLSSPHAPNNPAAGARNLLQSCAGVQMRDSVLLVVEPQRFAHYDLKMVELITEAARSLCASVHIISVPPTAGPEEVPADLMSSIASANHTIFLNRIGDQLRFSPLPGHGSKTMCYALDLDLLGSAFAVTPYAVWEGIHAALSARVAAATRYRVQCPRGTDLTMQIDPSLPPRKGGTGFTVKNFPIMIVPPVPAYALSGKLVLTQALTSTYVHFYENSVVPLDTPLTLTLDNGRVVNIEGKPELVARAQAQFARVGALFGGPTYALNSWHAGINPFTFFDRPALQDIDRWSSVVFGSPRYAHFHMCGTNPGDICGQIFDPTITFDDAVIWDEGHLAFLTQEDRAHLLEPLGLAPESFGAHNDIGIGTAAASGVAAHA